MSRLQEVFEGSYRRLVVQLYGICGEMGEAEDVVSEAFAKAASRPGQFDDLDNPEAWLRTVAVHVARSRHRRTVVAARWLRQQYEPPAEPRNDAETIDLVRAIGQLPRAQREAVALYYLTDLPVAEVAETLGVTPGAVKVRLARARANLAGLLPDPDSSPTTIKGETHV